MHRCQGIKGAHGRNTPSFRIPPKKDQLAKKTLVQRLLSHRHDDDGGAATEASTSEGPPSVVAVAVQGEETEAYLETANTNWLVQEALKRRCIDANVAQASWEYDKIVVKRYLGSVLTPRKDAGLLHAIEEYVKMMSRIRAAGSKLLNIFAIRAIDSGRDIDLKSTLLDQTFVKWALLPLKGEASKRKAAEPPHPELAALWKEFKPILLPMYPTLVELRRMSWDQALSDASREYIGAFKAHVMTHFATRIKAYVRTVLISDYGLQIRKDPQTGRAMATLGDAASFFQSDVYDYLEKAEPPELPLPPLVMALVAGIRERLELCDEKAKLSNVTFGEQAFRLHVMMSRDRELRIRRGANNLKPFSACPVVKTHRSFAYLDTRVVESLSSGFKVKASRGVEDFATCLGIDRRGWNAANKRARRCRRAKSSKRRAACGAGSFPKGWTPTSACTDGVAICVTLSKPKLAEAPSVEAIGKKKKKSDKPAAVLYAERVQAFVASHGGADNVHLIAEDPGRCTLFQAAQKSSERSFVHSKLTRRQLLRWTLQDRRQAQETARRASRPALRAAIETLSTGTWRTTTEARFVGMLRKQLSVDDTLVEEYVEDRWYASWKMLLWRRKRSVLMQSYASVLRKVAPKGSSIFYGHGDAGFAASGRGEQSVPTKGRLDALRRTAKCLRSVCDVGVGAVDEFRTTMCCHGCQHALEDVRPPVMPGFPASQPLRGLKLCRRCKGHVLESTTEEGGAMDGFSELRDEDGDVVWGLQMRVARDGDGDRSCRVRNRDKNASRNIWEALNAMARGLERPEYLRRAARRGPGRRQRVT